FRLLPKLHAKLLLIDNEYLLVGSANLTAFGLSLVPGGNRELGVCLAATEPDIRAAWGLSNEAVPVTQELFALISKWLEDQPQSTANSLWSKWPDFIERAISHAPSRLWVADLPWALPEHLLAAGSSTRDEGVAHDLRLFGSNKRDELRRAFRNSVC